MNAKATTRRPIRGLCKDTPSGAILALVLALSLPLSCMSVAPGTTQTSEAVSQGLRRLCDQHRATALALGRSVRLAIDARWNKDLVDGLVARDVAIDGDSNDERLARVARQVATARDRFTQLVDDRESELLEAIDRSYAGVLELNAIVTARVAAVEEVRDVESELRTRLLAAVPLSTRSPAEVDRLLDLAIQPESILFADLVPESSQPPLELSPKSPEAPSETEKKDPGDSSGTPGDTIEPPAPAKPKRRIAVVGT